MKKRSLLKELIISYLPVLSLFLMSYLIMVKSGKNFQDILNQVTNITNLSLNKGKH
jgi:hypothetical protein